MALTPIILAKDEILSLVDKISVFGGLTPDQINYLISLTEPVSCPKDHVLFTQGDQPTAMYIVLSGNVQLFFCINNQKLAKINWGPGTCIGMTAVLGIQTHAGTTVALDECQLLRFTGEKLMTIFEQDKDLFSRLVLNMARDASRRLHHTDQLIIEHMSANPAMLSKLLSDVI